LREVGFHNPRLQGILTRIDEPDPSHYPTVLAPNTQREQAKGV